ncbi:hypothetical protein GCM10011611_26390 [Aliidongia dinghuensis]|uniref:Uncharacterized protein n=1 Tax=Aliidongia dinghuensis TaxID=1867774 RepID=A0A8J3E3W1_9PROT|nr:hypothetical protein [Aliidongia dinghuensis]GGF19211.1 hypothetical protein GCM10011611_26390 [Aliidongia dinghuensis]
MAKSPAPVATVDPVADAKHALDTIDTLRNELAERLSAVDARTEKLTAEQRDLAPAAILSGDDASRVRLLAIRAELDGMSHDKVETQAAIEAVDAQRVKAQTVLANAEYEAALDKGAEWAAAYMVVAERIDVRLDELGADIDLLHNLHVRLVGLNDKLGVARVAPAMLWHKGFIAEAAHAAGQALGFGLGLERLKALPACQRLSDRTRRVLRGLLVRHDEVLKRAA